MKCGCLALCLIVLLPFVVVVSVHLMNAPRVTRQKYEMIKEGMTVDDVERVIGMRSDEFAGIPEGVDYDWPFGPEVPMVVFVDDNAAIVLSVDQDGIVYAKKFAPRHRPWADDFRGVFGFDPPFVDTPDSLILLPAE